MPVFTTILGQNRGDWSVNMLSNLVSVLCSFAVYLAPVALVSFLLLSSQVNRSFYPFRAVSHLCKPFLSPPWFSALTSKTTGLQHQWGKQNLTNILDLYSEHITTLFRVLTTYFLSYTHRINGQLESLLCVQVQLFDRRWNGNKLVISIISIILSFLLVFLSYCGSTVVRLLCCCIMQVDVWYSDLRNRLGYVMCVYCTWQDASRTLGLINLN